MNRKNTNNTKIFLGCKNSSAHVQWMIEMSQLKIDCIELLHSKDCEVSMQVGKGGRQRL